MQPIGKKALPALAMVLALGSACGDFASVMPSVDDKPREATSHLEIRRDAPDQIEEINYRGQKRVAARYGNQYVIEGDILVGPGDLAVPLQKRDGSKSVHISGLWNGALMQWPGGVVPYTFDSSVSATVPPGGTSQQQYFLNAMKQWSDTTPGLSFVPRTSEAGYLTFRIITSNAICGQSYVGRQGSQQFVDLTASCLPGYSTHHEIGHALGLFHEQSRTDLASSITINWNNIQGCTSAATSRAQCGTSACTSNPLDCGCTAAQVSGGSCDYSGNFGAPANAADVNAYDFDSVMHYHATAFGKCRDGSGTVVLCSSGGTVQATLVPPAGVTIGQRNRLSDGDKSAMHTMYPATRLPPVVFARSGSQVLCRVTGRQNDVGSYFSYTGFSAAAGSASVDTTSLAPGSVSAGCSARSLFWRKGYRYPNSTVTTTLSELNATPSVVETYSASGTVRVLDPGFIVGLSSI